MYFCNAMKQRTSQGIDDVTVTKYELIFSWTLRAEAWMAKVQIMHEFKGIDRGYPSMQFL